MATCHHQDDAQGSSGITTHLLEGRPVGVGSLEYQMVDRTRDSGNSLVLHENARVECGPFSEVAISCTRGTHVRVDRRAILYVLRSTIHTCASFIRTS